MVFKNFRDGKDESQSIRLMKHPEIGWSLCLKQASESDVGFLKINRNATFFCGDWILSILYRCLSSWTVASAFWNRIEPTKKLTHSIIKFYV